MDLIPSQNLTQAVTRHGPLPQEQVAEIGLSVLDALTASHAAGILHRDVKPANVLLTTDGHVLLTDFGIAVQEADLTMTASGVLIGSPEFVAPERARGQACDGASDLFSLGATLYFAAEGRSPFPRDTAVGVLTAILFDDTAPVTRVPALAPLISGLLTKDPATRWDAARARQELERLSGAPAGGGTRVPMSPPMPSPPMPSPKKNTGRNVGLVVGALVMIGGVVAAMALSGGSGKKTQNANTPPTSPVVNGPDSSQPSDTARTEWSESPATWDSSSTDQTPFTTDALLPVTFTDDKGVVYTATNRWTDKCVNSYESPQLKAMLTQYKCDTQAIGTYTDSDGRIMVDVAVLPLPDAKTAKTAFATMQSKEAFTVEDWGIWCPKSGPGADICTSKKNTGNAQQYGYIQPDHRYLIHAVSLYANLTTDPSAQSWLRPAATSAAKLGGPQVAVQ